MIIRIVTDYRPRDDFFEIEVCFGIIFCKNTNNTSSINETARTICLFFVSI